MGKIKEASGIPVLVTGFGPFGDHRVNISWEIAKVLPSFNLESHGINLILNEIPVAYSVVEEAVPQLWKKHNPRLVVHLGLSAMSDIFLETVAHKSGYKNPDILGKLPENGRAKGEQQILFTSLDAESVAQTLGNSAIVDVPIQVSRYAGRYLCEFIFYTSLNIDRSRTIFVHVPNIDKGYTVLQMATAVKEIIFLLLEQVSKL